MKARPVATAQGARSPGDRSPSPQAALRKTAAAQPIPPAAGLFPNAPAKTTQPPVGRAPSPRAEEARLLSEIPKTSWMSPSLVLTQNAEKGGRAIVALAPIPRGALLTTWGGQVYIREAFAKLSENEQTHGLQITEERYLLSDDREDPTDFFNHSCDPNAGIQGLNQLVARRDIATGEEVCFDYAMTDGSPYDEFACRCGTSDCRGMVTGDDWKREDVQKKYGDMFLPYLRERIAKERAARRASPEVQ